jgi:hypothetical protein
MFNRLEACLQHRKPLLRRAGTLSEIQSRDFNNTKYNFNYRAAKFSPSGAAETAAGSNLCQYYYKHTASAGTICSPHSRCY